VRQFAGIGATLGFFAVAFGAFGAHAVRDRISPDMLAVYQTGVQYQAMHALALLALGLSSLNTRLARTAGWFFLAGVIVFSGSLYALALTGTRAFGAITPLGGVCFLLGWGLLARTLLARTRTNTD
jgi:uncharacterized membrane protein YgdD (TMEM256/DUF423 family)